jgi:TolB protein
MKTKLLIRMFVAAVVVASALPSAAASSEAGTQLIAYERWVGDGSPDEEIWVMEPDGSGQRKLADGCCFDWSPDGRAIAFVTEQGGLSTIRADGSELRRFTASGAYDSPSWSPDDKRIAYAGNHEGRGLYVVAVTGGAPMRLTDGWDDSVDWSPNGKQILVQRFYPNGGGDDILVVNADGSGERRLTHGYGHESPAWSPGARKIAYLSYSGDRFKIALMNADGSGVSVLETTWATQDEPPAWSAGGARILFASRNGPIYSIRPDGRRHRLLTQGHNAHPQWSSDGRSIVFQRDAKHQLDVYVMTASGTRVTNLTNTPRPLLEAAPSWSPTGR